MKMCAVFNARFKTGSYTPVWFMVDSYQSQKDRFLPARRYASAGNSDRNVSVRLSVRLSAPVLCQNEES